MKILILAALLALLALAAPAARASILTAGNFQTGTPTPTLSLSAPIVFTITTTGTVNYLAFDEWVTSDGSQTLAQSNGTQFLTYQINGGAAQTVAVTSLVDNIAATQGAFTANDGALVFNNAINGIAVTAGQTLTFNAGALTFRSGTATFNPPPAVFNGNAFLLSLNNGTYPRLSASTAVPEPATWALLGVGVAGLGVVTLRRVRHV